MKLNLLICILFLLFIASCISCKSSQNKVNDKQKNVEVIENKGEGFNKFIKLFYTDSSFQMNRINFPLKGTHYRNNEVDFESKVLTNWGKNEWKFIKNIFPDNDSITVIDRDTYKRRISKTDTLVTENIFIENSGYNRKLKYAKKNGKWYLIYYEEASF